MPSREPIEITEQTVVDVQNGLVSLHFTLKGPASSGWRVIFAMPRGGRKGSGGFVMGPDPVAKRERIEWTVPEGDMEDAVRHVRERVAATNTVLEQQVAKTRQAAVNESVVEQAKQARVAEVQKRLDQI